MSSVKVRVVVGGVVHHYHEVLSSFNKGMIASRISIFVLLLGVDCVCIILYAYTKKISILVLVSGGKSRWV